MLRPTKRCKAARSGPRAGSVLRGRPIRFGAGISGSISPHSAFVRSPSNLSNPTEEPQTAEITHFLERTLRRGTSNWPLTKFPLR